MVVKRSVETPVDPLALAPDLCLVIDAPDLTHLETVIADATTTQDVAMIVTTTIEPTDAPVAEEETVEVIVKAARAAMPLTVRMVTTRT